MSKQQKQQYLTEAIISKGYDCEVFIQYLTEIILNENPHADLETEIQNLSLPNLKKIVQKFTLGQVKPHTADDNDQFEDFQGPVTAENNINEPKIQNHVDFDWGLLAIKPKQTQKHKQQTKKIQPPSKQINTSSNSKPPTKNVQQKEPKKQIPITTSILDLQPSKQSVEIKKNENVLISNTEMSKIFEEALKNDSVNKAKINCLKLQENILEHHLNINFTITDMAIKDKQKTYINMLFKATEVLYTVKTEGRNKNNAVGIAWTVKRKFSDFIWLKNILVKFYPGLIIPPLPKQPDLESEASQTSAKNKLEYFLKEIYKQKELRNSKYFQIFLSYINPTDFENEKKKGEGFSKPKGLGHILNNKGEVQCNYNIGINSYSTLIAQYVVKSSNSMKKIKEICKEIGFIYDNLALKFHEFAEICVELKQNTDVIAAGNKQIRCFEKLSKTYKYITDLVNQHSYIVLKQKQKINSYFGDFFSYEKTKLENVNGLIDKRNEFATLYAKASYNPNAGSGMFSKFSSAVFGEKQQFIDKPSSNFETLKNQFGYYNNQLLKETFRFIENQVISYIEHFTAYGDSRIGQVDEMQEYWSQVMVSGSKLNVDSYF